MYWICENYVKDYRLWENYVRDVLSLRKLCNRFTECEKNL